MPALTALKIALSIYFLELDQVNCTINEHKKSGVRNISAINLCRVDHLQAQHILYNVPVASF